MARTTRHLWWVGAVVATASVMSALAGAAAAAGGEPSRTTVAHGTSATEVLPQPAGATHSGGGLDRRDGLVAAAIVTGGLFGLVPALRVMLGPLISFVRALPPLAYLSLLVIWFGLTSSPRLKAGDSRG